jgi:two-component system CheB/CheR fusion protein
MTKDSNFFVVCIGASAGGLNALQELFSRLPENSGAAYIVVQHLSPDFKSLMSELLSKKTKMVVRTAEDDMLIQPNHIYLNSRHSHLTVSGNRLKLVDKNIDKTINHPIDLCLNSVAYTYKERAIAVVLSGTGTDGSKGILSIKEHGGIVITQDPEEAQFDGMPKAAIKTEYVDFIEPVRDIAETILRLQITHQDTVEYHSSTPEAEKVIGYIFEKIKKHYGIDFGKYKRNTLLRRMEKRMNQLSLKNIGEYNQYMEENPSEVLHLKDDFLIGVTEFFRDGKAFEILKTKVIPKLLGKKNKFETLRIWVAGCSTGEEVYSLAILIDEYIQSRKLTQDFKIFASDVKVESLDYASQGRYPYNKLQDLDDEILETYFIPLSNEYQIIDRLRERIVFSRHDVLSDPPFIRVDLISCRNLLIYLDPPAQQKVLTEFHFALNSDGVLFLGNSENLGDTENYFNVVDDKWKIYANAHHNKFANVDLTLGGGLKHSKRSFVRTSGILEKRSFSTDKFEKSVLNFLNQKYSPSLVILDKDFKIRYSQGAIINRFSPRSGVFDSNFNNMISSELSSVIKMGVSQLNADKRSILVKNIKDPKVNDQVNFDVTISKEFIDGLDEELYLLEFSEEREIKELKEDAVIEAQNFEPNEFLMHRVKELEDELKETQFELRRTVEEVETNNEELQSSNEELMASNEELQSTNEELQSVNEELYTVNSELQAKNHELGVLNNDVNNLLENNDVGTLFLDPELKIRKFTKAVKNFFSLQEEDVGRSIEIFSSSFVSKNKKLIIDACRDILKNLGSFDQEIQDKEGNSFLVRIRPFLTISNKVEGVVVSFIDNSKLNEVKSQLENYNEMLNLAYNLTNMAAWEWDCVNDTTVPLNESWFDIHEFETKHVIKQWKASMSPEDAEKAWQPIVDHLEGKTDYFEHLYKMTTPVSKTEKWVSGKGKIIKWDEDGKPLKVIGVSVDVTENINLINQLKDEKDFIKKVTDTAPNGIYVYDFDQQTNTYMNSRYTELLGYTLEEINSLSMDEFIKLFHKDDRKAIIKHMELLQTGKSEEIEYRFKHKNGKWRTLLSKDVPFRYDSKGHVVSFIGSFVDISETRVNERKVNMLYKKAENANLLKNQFLANMSHEIRTPMNGIIGLTELLKDEELGSEEASRYIRYIQASCNQLLKLINDIIDISKIESDQFKIERGPCQLNSLMERMLVSLDEVRHMKGKNNIRLKLKVPKNTKDLVIETDAVRLEQVLVNLINNAIKFSNAGDVIFGYEVLSDKTVEFFVKDEGIGIPKSKLTEIFNRFEQVNRDPTLKIEGTGLGLSISKGIVEKLGGTLSVDSELGVGSTFSFALPYEKYSGELYELESNRKKQIDITTLGKGKKMLIAEDQKFNSTFFKALFKKSQFTMYYAEDGVEALQLYKAHKDIDLVLLDIRMPKMTGDEVAEKILKINPDAKIIAQTAFAMQDDENKFMKAGFIDYISKPIKKDELLEKVQYYTEDAMVTNKVLK